MIRIGDGRYTGVLPKLIRQHGPQGTYRGGEEIVRVVTVHLPEPYLQAIDELVRRRLYPNRAEAIRMAVRDFIRVEVQVSE